MTKETVYRMTCCLPMAILIISLLSSCALTPAEESPYDTFEKYDTYCRLLQEEVRGGSLTVSDAEALRHEAFLQYLDTLKQKKLEREKRNY